MNFPREPNAASAVPVLAQLPDLPEDLGQMTGVALLETLCAHMEPSAAAKTGATAPLCEHLHICTLVQQEASCMTGAVCSLTPTSSGCPPLALHVSEALCKGERRMLVLHDGGVEGIAKHIKRRCIQDRGKIGWRSFTACCSA